MGVTWTFEFITWFADTQNWLVYATDVCNCISGVFIFFLFVWKRKVWKLLQQRLSSARNTGRRTGISLPTVVLFLIAGLAVRKCKNATRHCFR